MDAAAGPASRAMGAVGGSASGKRDSLGNGGAGGAPLPPVSYTHLDVYKRQTLGQPLTLGDFVVEATPADPSGIQGKIQDDNGPLTLAGTFILLPDGRYRFSGQAAVRDAGNQALRQALNLLGPPDGNGRWTLNFSGILAW